ncbi:MAG: hypothetical protein JRI41_01945 [Deltaproteobacteria bacterium]|nr:hypothetical protein [Deltaproteobacteria bacterium]
MSIGAECRHFSFKAPAANVICGSAFGSPPSGTMQVGYQTLAEGSMKGCNA